jgi:pyruvate kinase
LKNKIKILVTLGPSSLTKKFLKLALKSNISFLRLNMSHVKISKLEKTIKFIRKYNNKTPICIDTEGAQIRTKVYKKKYIKKDSKIKLYKENNIFKLYPEEVFSKLKRNDILSIGFDNLKVKILQKNNNFCVLRSLSGGYLEGNKGVHLQNRKIKLNFLTYKDKQAIQIGKQNKIKNYALSFTNTHRDVLDFKKILKKENKIYKLETLSSVKNLSKILKYGDNFLIDRGDLSKETEIEKIPYYQRKIIKKIKRFKGKEIYVATNLLESMIKNSYPTRAEANDIYNCMELGSNGLVLAAETAVGKYPENSIFFLKKMIHQYLKKKDK